MKSTKHCVQNQLASNRALGHFVSSWPSHFFVFLSRPLLSRSVGQSACSKVFISAAGLPSSRRDKQLFKILRSSPPTNLPLTQNFSSHRSQVLQPSFCFAPVTLSLLHVTANHPLLCSSRDWLPGGLGGVLDQSAVLVCVCH